MSQKQFYYEQGKRFLCAIKISIAQKRTSQIEKMRFFVLFLCAAYRECSAEDPLIEKGICFDMPGSHFQVLTALSNNWKCTIPKCCFGDYTIWDGRVECEVEDNPEVFYNNKSNGLIYIKKTVDGIDIGHCKVSKTGWAVIGATIAAVVIGILIISCIINCFCKCCCCFKK